MKTLNKLAVLLIFLVALLPAVTAQIAVSSFTLSPQTVIPGSEINIDLTLENVGDQDIENVLVTLDLSTVPFVPVGSSNEKIIEEINDGDEEKVTFRVKALPNAEPLVYKIPVVISYGEASKTSLISVEVATKAHLDLLLEKSELVKVNDHGKVTLKFVNDGLAQVKNLKITLKESPLYELFSPGILYIGEVDIGDFETEEFTLAPLTKDPILNVELEYRDAANNQFHESKLIKIPVYTEEEAKQLGLVKSGNKILPIGAVILVLGAIFYYRRRKKKKNAL